MILCACVQVFCGECVEDAHVMCAVCEEYAGEKEKRGGGGGGGEGGGDRQTSRLQAWCDVLQVNTCTFMLVITYMYVYMYR